MKKILFLTLLALSINVNTSVTHAEDSRPCSVYPASVTPECVAENLAFEAQQQANYKEQVYKQQLEAQELAEIQNQKNFEANGARPCSVFPASLTPICIQENLTYEADRQAKYQEEEKLKAEEVRKAAEAQAQKDFKANGSRACSIAPASETEFCQKENLVYEKNRKTTELLLIKLRNIKSQTASSKVSLPASNTINEKYVISTPKVCKLVGNSLVRIKSGTCIFTVYYSANQIFLTETTKIIQFK